MSLHPTAIIHATAELGENVEVGPYSVIGPRCIVGAGTKIGAHTVIESHTAIGESCTIASGAIIGGLPQDVNFKGEDSYISIGNNTVIRECATINRASGEGLKTVVGENCMLMAYSHLGHNVQLGNGVILANSVQLGGLVEVGDYAFIGGGTVVHQSVRIGAIAMVGGASGTRQDLPPFSTSDGRPTVVLGLNRVGLKRRNVSVETRNHLKQAFRLLWFSGIPISEAVQEVRQGLGSDPLVAELLTFIETSKRGIHRSVNYHAYKRRDGDIEMEEPVLL